MDRGKSKLAQSATNAAITVLLIAVLVVFYILFLSPEDRANLLGEDSNGSGDGTGTVKSVLFSKFIGRLDVPSPGVTEHTMPSFMVFTVTNAGELKRISSMYVKNSAFGDSTEELTFVYDFKTMNDPKLSFSIKKYTGRLIITLNGNKIYDQEPDTLSPQPIRLPLEYLKDKNSLVFQVSEPGAAFWRVNEYTIENILISAQITDYSSAFSEQHFSLGDDEFTNMEKAVLDFLPDCPPNEAGMVQILMNNRAVYTGYPDCGVATRIEISKEFLRVGDNILVATTSTGAFLIDMPKLTTFLKESVQPVFYFNIPDALMNAVYNGQNGLLLTLRFTDATSVKRGIMDINGFKISFETQDIIYQTLLDPGSVTAGPNSVKITPQSNAIDVAELRVDVI